MVARWWCGARGVGLDEVPKARKEDVSRLASSGVERWLVQTPLVGYETFERRLVEDTIPVDDELNQVNTD